MIRAINLIGTEVVMIITFYKQIYFDSNWYVKCVMRAVVIYTCVPSASDECMRFVVGHTLLKLAAHYLIHVKLKVWTMEIKENNLFDENQLITIV